MLYLASPYSNEDPAVREKCHSAAVQAATFLRRLGHAVFAPIVNGHPLVAQGWPTDWTFWRQFDQPILERCDSIVVLTLAGWQESIGVLAEINLAIQLGKPVFFLSPASIQML